MSRFLTLFPVYALTGPSYCETCTMYGDVRVDVKRARASSSRVGIWNVLQMTEFFHVSNIVSTFWKNCQRLEKVGKFFIISILERIFIYKNFHKNCSHDSARWNTIWYAFDVTRAETDDPSDGNSTCHRGSANVICFRIMFSRD